MFLKLFRTHINSCNGYTLIEVLVSSTILTLTVAGVFSSSAALRQPSDTSYRRLEAAYAAKNYLTSLKTSVNPNTWDLPTSSLKLNTTYGPTKWAYGNSVYTIEYKVTPDPQGTNSRRVEVIIDY